MSTGRSGLVLALGCALGVLILGACASTDSADVESHTPSTVQPNDVDFESPTSSAQPTSSASTSSTPDQEPRTTSDVPPSSTTSEPTTTVPSAGSTESLRPGLFTFSIAGTEKQGVINRRVQREGHQRIESLGEGRFSIVDSTHAFESTQRSTVVSGGSRIDLLRLQIEGLGQTRTFKFSPGVLLSPDPVPDGANWSWTGTSDDGSVTLSASSEYQRKERLSVAEQQYDTTVVTTTLRFDGDVTGEVKVTAWFATGLPVPVRVHEVTSLKSGAFDLAADLVSEFESESSE